jgi:hypothetical protein
MEEHKLRAYENMALDARVEAGPNTSTITL